MKLKSNKYLVTPESPWLGLRPFTANESDYFFGRTDEVEDLFERVAQRPLTTLYGHSGLGKTSLLQAALIPRLKKEGYLPILLRLHYSKDGPTLIKQVISSLSEAYLDAGFRLQARTLYKSYIKRSHRDLWLLFHDPDYGLCNNSSLPTPVIIFDQFEEIFTLGEQNLFTTQISEFKNSLATLIENKISDNLRNLIENDENLAERINYQIQPLKIILTLRHDYLHQLERWRPRIPSLANNRVELLRLSGLKALEAVVRPGHIRSRDKAIIPDEVGSAIVRFVAGCNDSKIPLEQIDNVPPLLSLICAELNEARLLEGQEQITQRQFTGNSSEILIQFYNRSFEPNTYSDFSTKDEDLVYALDRLQLLVESRLLSIDGYRESIAYDTILHELAEVSSANTAEQVLTALIKRRLLTSDERDGVQRIELTHDVLTSVVKTSRDERLDQETIKKAETKLKLAEEEARTSNLQKNRLRRWVVASSIIAVLAICSSLVAVYFYSRATEIKKEAQLSEKKALEAKSIALEHLDLAIKFLALTYSENIASIDTTPSSTLESVRVFKIHNRNATIGRLKMISKYDSGHHTTILLLVRIHLDEYYDKGVIQRKWDESAESLKSAFDAIQKIDGLSLEKAELLAEIYFNQGILDYFTNNKSYKLCDENHSKIKSLETQYKKSWKIAYYSLRNQNNQIHRQLDNTTQFLKLSRKLTDLSKKIEGNFDIVLWAFITHLNAFSNKETWEKMSLTDFQKLVSKFPQSEMYNPIQMDEAAWRISRLLTNVSNRINYNVKKDNKGDIDQRRKILKSLYTIVEELEAKLPTSKIVLDQKSNYLLLERKCFNHGINWRSENDYKLAKDAHDTRAAEFGSTKSSISKMAKSTGASATSTSKDDLKKLINNTKFHHDFKRSLDRAKHYDLSKFTKLLNVGPVSSVVTHIDKLEESPLKSMGEEMLALYIKAFQAASPSEKLNHLSIYCAATENRLQVWFKQENYAKITEFWKNSYTGVNFDYDTDEGRSSLVTHAQYAARSFLRTDDKYSALEIKAKIDSMSKMILKKRPWDWYLTQNTFNFFLYLGADLRKSGYEKEAQPILKRGWELFAYQVGEKIDLNREEWPIRGEMPVNVTIDEKPLFSRLLPKTDKKKTGGMKMFVIPCIVNGVKVPIQFYILRGKRGYEGIVDQFKWIKFYRGVEAPLDVQDALKKLNDIAIENNVSFLDLCTYALKYPTNEKKSSNNNDQPSETKKEE